MTSTLQTEHVSTNFCAEEEEEGEGGLPWGNGDFLGPGVLTLVLALLQIGVHQQSVRSLRSSPDLPPKSSMEGGLKAGSFSFLALPLATRPKRFLHLPHVALASIWLSRSYSKDDEMNISLTL